VTSKKAFIESLKWIKEGRFSLAKAIVLGFLLLCGFRSVAQDEHALHEVYPAQNRDGRHIIQRLLFPFDRSLKARVPEDFINDFGSSVAALAPISGGEKQLAIRVAALGSDESKHVLETIFRFVEKAAGK